MVVFFNSASKRKEWIYLLYQLFLSLVYTRPALVHTVHDASSSVQHWLRLPPFAPYMAFITKLKHHSLKLHYTVNLLEYYVTRISCFSTVQTVTVWHVFSKRNVKNEANAIVLVVQATTGATTQLYNGFSETYEWHHGDYSISMVNAIYGFLLRACRCSSVTLEQFFCFDNVHCWECSLESRAKHGQGLYCQFGKSWH